MNAYRTAFFRTCRPELEDWIETFPPVVQRLPGGVSATVAHLEIVEALLATAACLSPRASGEAARPGDLQALRPVLTALVAGDVGPVPVAGGPDAEVTSDLDVFEAARALQLEARAAGEPLVAREADGDKIL